MSSGWIKLHRRLLEWEWYDDINVKVVFLHLLLKANHKHKRYKGTIVDPGVVLTGRELLASEVGLSVRQIRTALNKLKSTNEVTIKSTTKGTEIQIVKYEDYQLATSKKTNKRPTSDQLATTNNNVKNVKNEIIDYNILLDFYNKLLGKKARTVSDKVKRQLNARLNEGYSKQDLVTALRNASKDKYHIDNNYKYITLEFITRADKLDRFLNINDYKKQTRHQV